MCLNFLSKGASMIDSGTILMWTAADRPECFRDDGAVDCPSAWKAVSHTLSPRALEDELSSTGWTFFYMANPVNATAYGFDPAKRMASVLKRIASTVRQQGCNCLQVDRVTTCSTLGIPYVTVSAHPRHIQKGKTFVGQ